MENSPKKNVLITGSTGMIGSLILEKCLAHSNIGRVITVDRKPNSVTHPKLDQIIHQDFSDFSDKEHIFKDIDIVFYCVGVYTGAVPDDEFRKITVDYTRNFAQILKQHSPKATFCFLSGAGADQTEQSRVMFARDKGTAENILIQLEFPRIYFFRPGYIYPTTPRKEPNLMYRILRTLYPIMRRISPNSSITSQQLAQGMVIAGLYGTPKQELENTDILALVESK